MDPALLRMEQDLPPPPRLPIGDRVIREPRQACAIGVDDVDFVVPVAEGGEGDPVSIGRPGGTEIVAAVRELEQACAVNVDDVDVVVASGTAIKGEPRPIG